jgi:hypothetical protein
MPDPSRDLLTFAPRPQRIAFLIDGTRVETALYSFLDLRGAQAIEVWHLEDEMRAALEDFPRRVKCTQAIVRLLCPELTDEQVEALAPNQLLAAIGASHGVAGPSRDAGVEVTASPSPSAPSTTDSPPAITGDSPT